MELNVTIKSRLRLRSVSRDTVVEKANASAAAAARASFEVSFIVDFCG
jgi:hypothetical protein